MRKGSRLNTHSNCYLEKLYRFPWQPQTVAAREHKDFGAAAAAATTATTATALTFWAARMDGRTHAHRYMQDGGPPRAVRVFASFTQQVSLLVAQMKICFIACACVRATNAFEHFPDSFSLAAKQPWRIETVRFCFAVRSLALCSVFRHINIVLTLFILLHRMGVPRARFLHARSMSSF